MPLLRMRFGRARRPQRAFTSQGKSLPSQWIGRPKALRVKRANGHVAFEVEDHGAGLADGDEARIFEPFYRRSDQGSLGLGLALVKRIAEAHGGRAYAENRDKGGARVGVELPVPA